VCGCVCARAHVRLKSSKFVILLHFVLCFCRRCCKERERERERELVEEFGKRRRRSFFCLCCVLCCVSVGVVAKRRETDRQTEGIWKNKNKKYGRRSCGFLFFCEGVGK
jgi:hypothetical protein